MPFIHTITNKTVNDEQEALLRQRLGCAIERIPGKSEQWLMLALSDGRRMAFRGKADADMAMIEVSIFGTTTAEAKADFTAAVCDIFTQVLGISADHIYVKYAEVADWGFDGENF